MTVTHLSWVSHRRLPIRPTLIPAMALLALTAACGGDDPPSTTWMPGSGNSAPTTGTTTGGSDDSTTTGSTTAGTTGDAPTTGTTGAMATTGTTGAMATTGTTGDMATTGSTTTGATGSTVGDGGVPPDASMLDGSTDDASTEDGGMLDGSTDDASTEDGGMLDGGDGSTEDGGMLDGSTEDGGMLDGSTEDGSTEDGATSMEDADVDAGDAMADSGPPREDLGEGDGSDVVTIGDSWMQYDDNGGGIERALEDASGQDYRNYAAAGAKLFKDTTISIGIIPIASADAIPKQYASAKQEGADIKTVVMTGGGNDVLLEDDIDDCDQNGSVGPKCVEQIGRMGERLVELWQEMGEDGVQDIVYIEYSSKGTNPAAVLLGAEQIREACADVAPARCHFVFADDYMGREQLLEDDPTAVFVGATPPIHPTEEGCDIMGQVTYDLMVAEGMRR